MPRERAFYLATKSEGWVVPRERAVVAESTISNMTISVVPRNRAGGRRRADTANYKQSFQDLQLHYFEFPEYSNQLSTHQSTNVSESTHSSGVQLIKILHNAVNYKNIENIGRVNIG